MKQLRITARAHADLMGIADYIAEHDGAAAARVGRRLMDALRGLAAKNTGRYGRVEGTFEKSVTGLPYVIVYRFPDREAVEILRIIHTRRNWPG